MAVQAGSIHGEVQINVDSQPRGPVPAQLAPAPAVFIGREQELGQLDGLLERTDRPAGTPTLIVISGLGGVGKSSLALQWLHQVRDRFGDGQLYADLRGFASGAPAVAGEVLERFLRALGIAPERVPAAVDEQVMLFRSATAGRRLIIMLDNAISAAQVRTVLPASSGSLVVVTTRRRLSGLVVEGAEFVELRPLSQQAAVGLLDRVLGAERIAAEPEAAGDLVGMCGRLPIAVCAAAARLALRPRWSIGRLVAELADAKRRLAVLSTGDDDTDPDTDTGGAGRGGDRASLQAVFDVSYDVLPDDQARLYRLLGVYPGGDFGPGVAGAAAGIDPARAGVLLDRLAGAHLVQEEATDRYRFHDLLRLHARVKMRQVERAEDRQAAFARIARWYLSAAAATDLVVIPGRWHLGEAYASARAAPAAFADPPEALDWLEAELPNLRAVLGKAHDQGLHEVAWQLCEAMWGLFIHRKHYREWIATDRLGLSCARACGDRLAEARMLVMLATAHANLRQFDQTAELAARAVQLERDADHPIGEAWALETLGISHLGLGRPEQAIDHFGQSLSIYERIGYRRGAALMTRRLGEAYRDAGRYDQAVETLTAAHRLLVAVPDRYNQARTLTALGQTLLLAGRAGAAREVLDQALATAQQIGALHEQASIRLHLADALHAVADLDGTRHQLAQALAVFTDLSAPQAEQARRRLQALPPTPPRPA